jgi:TonB-dependent starch-binding outer membrane protein SusC
MKKNKLYLITILLLVESFLYSQRTITGIIKDASNGDLLTGASVVIPSTTLGTITDIDGNFTLEVPNNATSFEVSYIGYTKKSITLSAENFYTILLSAGKVLDEVLVIGYGTIKKSDKTGAVTSVTSAELNTGRLSDPIEALQGKAAGVTISKQGGDPNSGFSVNIRGAASFTSGTGPLFVVDGVPGVDPTTIAANDIESYNVLKDASSTSIYGSRGANGVILITTKKGATGKEEQFNVDFSSQFSFDNVAKRYDLLSASEIRDFVTKTGRVFVDNKANVDWQDEIYRSGMTRDYNLSFTNSSKNSAIRTSLSHLNIEGVIKGSAKTRDIGRLNYTQNALNNVLTLNTVLSGTIEHNDYINYGGGSSPTNVIYQALRRSPTDKVRNDNNTFYETDRSFQYFNPLAIIEDIQNERDAKKLLGNMNIGINFHKNIKGWINMAYTRDDDESFYFEPSSTASNQTKGYGRRSYNNKSSRIFESTLTYANSWTKNQNFSLLGGYSYQIDNYDGFSAQGNNAASDYIKSYNLATLLTLDGSSIGGYKREDLLISFFSRALYDINNKYFVSASLRRDGSSKFGPNKEWGWFPSGSLGWNIHEESFLKNNKSINQLKLRFSYGISGNQNVPSDAEKTLYGPSGRAINPENGQQVLSFVVAGGTNPNPNLKWEENAEANLGLDFGFFNDKLSGSIELYQRTTSDLVYGFQVPVPPNKQRITIGNAGIIKNKGVELTLQYYPLSRTSFNWKTLLTFSTNKQNTDTLGNGEFKIGEIPTLYVSGRGLVGGINNAQVIRPGLAVGTFVMPEFAGLSADGKFLFYTAAGGITRDVDKAERRVVGSAQPDFQIGWSNFFKIGKKFDLSVSIRSIVGYKVLNVTRMVFSNPSDLPTLNVLKDALVEYDKGLNSSPILSSYYLENASFVRLDNVSLGYNINTNSKYFKNIRVFATGTNLFLVTGYKGIDPEIAFGGNEFGRDQYDVYPRTRTVTLGINAKF